MTATLRIDDHVARVTIDRPAVMNAIERMLLTGRRMGAAEALTMGLVNEVVPRASLGDILACAPVSLRAIKQSVRRSAQLSATEAQGLRLPAVMDCLASRDGDEGVQTFREKRAPVWTGR